jgi:radical SAM superfamily enzyme YgiQ (UPF0313 family)
MTKEKVSGSRVLLLTPPRGIWKDDVEKPWISTQPLGLAYVAAAVRDAGFPVEILDAYSFGNTADDIRAKIESFHPTIVGISSLTPQWPDAEKLAELIKQVDAEILTVVGGSHVTALPEEAVASSAVDVAVIGEGEGTMQEICEKVSSGGNLNTVAGIVLGLGGNIEKTQPRPLSTDLDSFSFPAHDLLPDPALYNPFPAWGNGGTFSCMISGRGCPYNCCFCDVTVQQGRRYRLRSAKNIVDEMTWLYNEYGVRTFSFRDPSVICNRKRLMEMCRLILERKLDIAWTCSARANEIDTEMLETMKTAGCRLIQYGIEVGNTGMLKKIKNISKERVIKAVHETKKAGIGAHGYFLFGFVDETVEMMDETIAFAKELDLVSAGFAVMVPFPGTQEFEKYEREGLLLSRDWRDYDVLGKPVYRHKNITNEQLAAAPRKAYRQFYLRPSVIAWHARKMTNLNVIRNYLRSAKIMFG